jgi:hypothetical protein
MRFALVNGFVDLLQLIAKINFSSLAISHTLQFTTARTESSQSAVSPPSLLAKASNGGRSSCSGFRKCPRLSLYRLHSVKSKSTLCYDRRSVRRSILVPGTHLGPMTIFLLVLDS